VTWNAGGSAVASKDSAERRRSPFTFCTTSSGPRNVHVAFSTLPSARSAPFTVACATVQEPSSAVTLFARTGTATATSRKSGRSGPVTSFGGRWHLSALVDDLLDAGRVTSGRILLTRRPVDLAEAVRRCLSTMTSAGRTEAHVVRLDLEPVWVNADETRIDQIISNLLDNAVKYMPAGGEIHVRVTAEGDGGVLQVADSGVGISAPTLPRVFDIFVQGDQTLDRAKGGLGIGLTLVRRLVELHGGTVHAASAGSGRGSTFTVRLPRTSAPAERTAPQALPPHGLTTPRRVLLVEDNDDAREMLRAGLALAGHDVHEAADGPSGIELAATTDLDVALIDICLPGLDGYEVARRIRAGDRSESMVLVAVTGYGQAEDRFRAREAGFDAHLTKPVASEQLLTLVATAERAGLNQASS